VRHADFFRAYITCGIGSFSALPLLSTLHGSLLVQQESITCYLIEDEIRAIKLTVPKV